MSGEGNNTRKKIRAKGESYEKEVEGENKEGMSK